MPARIPDSEIIGKKFGRGVAIKEIEKRKGDRFFELVCDCERRYAASLERLRSGNTKSCGCLRKEKFTFKSHGMSRTHFYMKWKKLKPRCLWSGDPDFKDYGGRGISVCEKWMDFMGFYEDMYEGYLRHLKKNGKRNTTLDRIDVNGNYCKENCRWATQIEQANNKTTSAMWEHGEKKMTIAEWSKETGIYQSRLWQRVNVLGWDIAKALTTPLQQREKCR